MNLDVDHVLKNLILYILHDQISGFWLFIQFDDESQYFEKLIEIHLHLVYLSHQNLLIVFFLPVYLPLHHEFEEFDRLFVVCWSKTIEGILDDFIKLTLRIVQLV